MRANDNTLPPLTTADAVRLARAVAAIDAAEDVLRTRLGLDWEHADMLVVRAARGILRMHFETEVDPDRQSFARALIKMAPMRHLDAEDAPHADAPGQEPA